MKRVASLYLPDLPTDRLRRIAGPTGRRHDSGLLARVVWADPEAAPEVGARIEDCSCPRGGGWRPGARWARRNEVEAQIEALPAHQKPPVRELGRRSEAAEVPFRSGPSARQPLSPRAPVQDHGPALVTKARSGSRIIVAAACPVARSLGLHPGMPLTQAQALMPGLETRNSEPEVDAAFLRQLATFAARRWSPRSAVSGEDGVWLDISGTAHLFGGERRMCLRILRFCERLGFSARIAVAGTPGAAHALARHNADPVSLCPPGGETQAIAALPVAALRVDEAVLALARRMGIATISDLIAMPRGPLARRFGGILLRRLDQALGRSGETFDPIVPEEPPEAVLRLLEPIATAEAIDQVLRDLLGLLMADLEGQGLAARTLILTCTRVDGEEQSLEIGTAQASRDIAHIHRLFAMKIEQIEPGFGIEAMRLIARRCEPLGPRPMGVLDAGQSVPDLGQLVDRLLLRLGPRALFRSCSVESDVPERSVRKVSPLGTANNGWPRHWPRPVRLLSPPEPIDKVLAELPDQPPVRFSWRGTTHIVRKADGPERVHGEWWKQRSEADHVRDYFQVEDSDGARFWLFRRGDGIDPRTGDHSWWLHGAFG